MKRFIFYLVAAISIIASVALPCIAGNPFPPVWASDPQDANCSNTYQPIVLYGTGSAAEACFCNTGDGLYDCVQIGAGSAQSCTGIITTFVDPPDTDATTTHFSLGVSCGAYGGASGDCAGFFGGSHAARDEWDSPAAITLSNMYVRASQGPGTGDTVTVTVATDAGDSALSCDITGTNFQCNDTTSTLDVAQGADVSIKHVTSCGGAACATASRLIVNLCVEPQ